MAAQQAAAADERPGDAELGDDDDERRSRLSGRTLGRQHFSSSDWL
jgi:hypothetical protein